MKHPFQSLVLIFLILFALPLPATTIAQENDPATIAESVLNLLIAGDYATVSGMMNAELQATLPPDVLQQVWEVQMLPYTGEFESVFHVESRDNLARLTVKFANAYWDMLLSIDEEGRIMGLYFLPSDPEKIGLYTPPDYADQSTFTELKVVVNGLPATLTIPKGEGPFPGVVLVHGSGAHDRDETIGVQKPFRDLAWGLASQGIVVLRYEKRTYIDTTLNLQTLTLDEEVTNDALAALDLLANHPEIDRVYLLGHSLGGLMAPKIASLTEVDLAGVIILAAPTRTMMELSTAQVEYLINFDGEVTVEEQTILDQVELGLEFIETLTAEAVGDPLLNFTRPQWLEFRTLDPVATALTLDVPLLVLQGERDYQVTLEDFAGWDVGLADYPDAYLISYTGLNHLFVLGDQPSSGADYQQPGNVAEVVILDIATWMNNH